MPQALIKYLGDTHICLDQARYLELFLGQQFDIGLVNFYSIYLKFVLQFSFLN